MNKIYRVVWNKSTQTWTAVSEYATAQGKSSSRSAVAGSEVKSTKGIRFIYTALASATLMLVSGQAVATTATGNNGYDAGADNYCYYDTESESVICGDSTTSTVKKVDAKTAKSVVIGKGATNTGESNVAVGISASSAGTSSVAVGDRAKAGSDQTIAVGQNAQANARWDVSIGRQAGWNATAPAGDKPEGRNVAIGDAALKNGLDVNNNNVMGTSAGENLKGSHNVIIGTYANAAEAITSAETAGSSSAQIGFKVRDIGGTQGVKHVDSSSTVAIGHRALSTYAGAVAVGQQAKAFGATTVAVGNSSRAVGNNSVAMGNTANAGSGSAIAIGLHANYDSTANTAEAKYRTTGASSVAIGARTHAGATHAVTIGTEATTSTTGQGSVAVGSFSKAVGINAAAVGQASQASGKNSFAGGNDSHAVGISAVSLGDGAGKGTATFANGVKTGGDYASGDSSTAVGTYTKAAGAGATAIGVAADAQAYRSVSVGAYSAASASSTVAVGDTSVASATGATAVGEGSLASELDATALGNDTVASGKQSLAVGNLSKATGLGATAIGNNSKAEAEGAQAFGQSSVASALNAAAVGRLATASGARASAFGVGNTASGESSFSGGDRTVAAGKGAIAIGTWGNEADPRGNKSSRADAPYSVVVGAAAEANQHSDSAVVIGNQASAAGASANSTAKDSVAIGYRSAVTAASTIAVGSNAKANGKSQAIAVGFNSEAIGYQATAIGSGASVGDNGAGVALGQGASVTANFGTALGRGSSVTAAEGVALGSQSKATIAANQVGADPLGAVAGNTSNSTWTSTHGAVSVGDSTTITRQITSVAAGTNDTDAVNVAQLNTVANHTKNVGDSIVNVLGGDAEIANDGSGRITMGKTTPDGIGGTGETTIDAAIKAAAKATKVTSNDKSVTVTPDAANNAYDLAVNTDGTTIVKDPTTGALKANTAPITSAVAGQPNAGSVSVASGGEGKLATAGDIANAINNSGFTLTAQGETSTASLVNPGETVDLSSGDGNLVISKDDTSNNINFNLAPTVTIGPENGSNAITIDGTKGNISGLAANLPVTTSTGTLTTAQTVPANPVIGNAATVGDVLNVGWNVQTNGDATDFVRAYDTVNFADGVGTTITSETDGNKTTFKVNVNAQGLAESAQLPVVYTNANGDKLYLVEKDDPNALGNKIKVFNTKPDGKGEDVDPPNVIASMQNATGDTKYPMTLTNVAAGVRANDTVNVSQLGIAGIYNTDADGNLAYTDEKGDTVYHKPDGTYVNAQGDSVIPRGKLILQNKGLNFAGNDGKGNTKLGDTWSIVGGNAGTAPTDPRTFTDGTFSGGNIKTTVKDGVVEITMADSPKFGDIVINAPSEGVQGQPDYKAAGRITGVADGVDDKDVATVKQLKEKTATTPLTVTGNKVADLTDADKSKLATAGDIANAINNTGFTLTTAKTADGELGANATNELIKAGDSVTVEADNNIKLTQVNGKISIATKKDVKFDSVTAGEGDNQVVLNNEGVKSGNTTVNNDGITIKAPANGGTTDVKLTANGLNNGGNKITNVAKGTSDTDAVNVGQLNEQLTATEKTTTAKAGSDKVTVQGTTTGNNTDYVIDLADSTKNSLAKADSALQGIQVNANGTAVTTLDKDNNTLDITQGDNITVSNDGGKVKVALNQDVTGLNSLTSKTITAGEGTNQVILDNTGVNFGGNTYISDAGLNANNKKVTNVANGDITATSKDAINGSQLYAVSTAIKNLMGGNANVDDAGNVTVSDIGGTGQSNIHDAIKTVKTTVKSTDNSIKVTANPADATNGTVFDISVNAQGLAESAQLPVVYTKADGTKVYKVGNKFFDNKEGTGTEIEATNIIASMQNADGTITPTTLANIKAGTKDTDAVNVSQLKGVADTLGGNASINADGTINTPTYNITNPADGAVIKAQNVGDALNALNTAVNNPLTFAGDTGLFNRNLGQTTTIKGGVTDENKLSNSNIGVVAKDGTLDIKLAKDIAIDSVSTGNTTVNNDGITIKAPANGGTTDVKLTANGLNNGGNKITNVAKGTVDTDAVNFAQLKEVQKTAKAAKTEVQAGNNMAVTYSTGADGQTIYNVATKPDVLFDSVTVGTTGTNQVVLDDTGVKVGGNTYISGTGLNANNKKVTNVAKGDVSANSKDTINGSQLYAHGEGVKNIIGGSTTYDPATGAYTNADIGGTGKGNIHDAIASINTTANAGWNVQTNAGNKTNVKPSDTVNFIDGKNIKITNDGTNITVATADNLNVASVTAGNTLVNNTGVKVGDVHVTADGINAGNQQITNLKSGLNGKTIDDIKADPNATERSNAATIGDLATVQSNVTNISNNVTNITNNVLGGNYVDSDGELTASGKLALKTYDVSGQEGTTDNTIISAIKNMNEGGIKYFHTNDGTNKPAGSKDNNNEDSNASGAYATAVGFRANAEGENALAFGKDSQALAKNAIAIGTGNIVTGENSGAIGDPSIINGANSYSVGNNNTVATDKTFVLGNEVKQTVANSVFLGDASSSTGVHTTANGGHYTYAGANDANVAGVSGSTAPVGVVSVGTEGGQTRQVQNVAAGVVSANSTDAINGSQLYDTHQAIGQLANQTVNLGNQLNNRIGDVEDKANAGVSSAMAMASLPQAYIPGKSMLTGGLATYNGEGAVAVGLSKLSDNGRWVLKMSGSADTKGNAGASIGAGFHF